MTDKKETIEILTCGECKYFKTKKCPDDVTDPEQKECTATTEYRQIISNLQKSVETGKFECSEQLTEIPKGGKKMAEPERKTLRENLIHDVGQVLQEYGNNSALVLTEEAIQERFNKLKEEAAAEIVDILKPELLS